MRRGNVHAHTHFEVIEFLGGELPTGFGVVYHDVVGALRMRPTLDVVYDSVPSGLFASVVAEYGVHDVDTRVSVRSVYGIYEVIVRFFEIGKRESVHRGVRYRFLNERIYLRPVIEIE